MVKSQAPKLGPSQRKQWLQALQQSAASSIAAGPPNPTSYRVVIDASVLFSGVLYGGKPEQVVSRVLQRHELICSEYITDELLSRLRACRPRLPQKWLHALRLALEPHCFPTEYIIGGLIRDPNDEPILQLALETQACIITGDKDFLDIRDRLPVPILTVAEAVELL